MFLNGAGWRRELHPVLGSSLHQQGAANCCALQGSDAVALQGVWAGSLDIADKPRLGNWNISVDVNGQLFSKTFQVAEYVLPKFQVNCHGIRIFEPPLVQSPRG